MRFTGNIESCYHFQNIMFLRGKVAGLIPDGAIGIFHWHNSSGRTMALGLTQPLTENKYQEYFLVVKAAGA
jgi:hypothetical protein